MSAEPLGLEAAVGPQIAHDFEALSALHADGWGEAWLSDDTPPGVRGRVRLDRYADRSADRSAGLPTGCAADRSAAGDGPASRARLLYLRFASRGSAVERANVQPFVASGLAFAHNGALPRPDALRKLLTPESSAGLTGTTDSELYFARLREHVARGDGARAALAAAIRQTVAELRGLYPEACLNTMLLSPDALFVVQSAGSVPVPLGAFAARGAAGESLPPEHDHRYNRLAWCRRPPAGPTRTGSVVVATAGVNTQRWLHFTENTVTVFPFDQSEPRTSDL
ncbi:class II glutamine amidotransferase [Subtercola endophyticus]|uniref:class II glutamine amidotransferase n=1 Tax=Subtercola endophyticus TaxID=2895559 RepID=UPI001E3B73FD|nr:class II glutamine amidotransferase [Subtercola endophyticus]UFS58685.1 class II glutamine amidotransferase [Subtercola endophyticus]